MGAAAPILVALFSIPVLVERMGTPRFGVMTLVWMVTGYLSLLELGIGRALTQLVSEKLGSRRKEEIPGLFWTGVKLMIGFGLFGAVSLAVMTPFLVERFLKIPNGLLMESRIAFYLLSATLPVVVGSTGLQAFLAAYQRFDLLNAVRIPVGALTYLAPLAVMPFSNSLVAAVTVIIAVRVIGAIVYFVMCLAIEPELRYSRGVQRRQVRPLLTFGGWATVSGATGLVMTFAERSFIGAMLSISAVAYYATPFEAITKVWLFTGALMGVFYPTFIVSFVSDRFRAGRLFDRAGNYVFIVTFPVALIAVLFAKEGLGLWLGAEFAENSALTLQMLAVGVLINGLAQVPFALVQAARRPDLLAKLNLVELPLYLVALWWVLPQYGIFGVAVAWTVKAGSNLLVLLMMVERLLPDTERSPFRIPVLAGGAVVVLAAGGTMVGMVAKLLFVTFAGLLFVIVVWRWVLTTEDRAFARGRLLSR